MSMRADRGGTSGHFRGASVTPERVGYGAERRLGLALHPGAGDVPAARAQPQLLSCVHSAAPLVPLAPSHNCAGAQSRQAARMMNSSQPQAQQGVWVAKRSHCLHAELYALCPSAL